MLKRCLLLSLTLFYFFPAALADSKTPVKAFSQLPTAYSMSLSPNGEYIAYLYNKDGNTYITTLNLNTGKMTGVTQTDKNKKHSRQSMSTNSKSD